MASPTAQRKRLLEDQMTSAEFKYKAAKRELIVELDQAKIDRGSEDSEIRCLAETRYNVLLTKLHRQNQTFDQVLLDFKSQIYDLEAHDLCQASHKPTIASTSPSSGASSRDPRPQYATTTSPSASTRINRIQKTEKSSSDSRPGPRSAQIKTRAASTKAGKTIEQIERLLIKGQFEGFSYIRTLPILVREYAEKGQRRNRWVQMHCAACGSTVKFNKEFFRGVTGVLNHINRSPCRGACDAQGLEPWDYVILHCMQEVSEEYVIMVMSGRAEIPRIYAQVSESDEPKETKEQAAERIRISRLQSNNSFYNKPPPRKHVPIIIDLDSDTELPKGQASGPVDQHDVHQPHYTQCQTLPITVNLASQSCGSNERAVTEPLVRTIEVNDASITIDQGTKDVARSGSA